MLKGKIENARMKNAINLQHVLTREARAQPASQNTVRTKLPKLSLPRFKGDVTKWITFWDSFESALHSNEATSQ